MHVRWSQVRGVSVLDDASSSVLGSLTEPLIDPDTGTIVGFFVDSFSPLTPQGAFLQSQDIVSWGAYVHILDADRLGSAEDLVRLQSLLSAERPMLGQVMRIRGSGRNVGRCADVQFDTRRLTVEWLFPRSWLFVSGQPIPASEIDEVTPEAIWVSDPLRSVPEKTRADRTASEDLSAAPVLPVQEPI